jgi:hypothetical protein
VPVSVRHRFVEAGWYPGRRCELGSQVPPFHPAAELLKEFGGLKVHPDQTGAECGTESIEFMELPQDVALVGMLSRHVGSSLIGIAEAGGGNGELYLAADGRFFGRSCIHEAYYFEGASFAEAVEKALLGRRVRPMLLPGQASVSLYGITYTAESLEVYTPQSGVGSRAGA